VSIREPTKTRFVCVFTNRYGPASIFSPRRVFTPWIVTLVLRDATGLFRFDFVADKKSSPDFD
jgi:hypothetical protein